MTIFFILTNLALTIIVGMGIYSFNESITWAIIWPLVITGSASANPIFALLAYPTVEYFFNDSGLTIYSAIVIGITVVQMGFIFYRTANNRN